MSVGSSPSSASGTGSRPSSSPSRQASCVLGPNHGSIGSRRGASVYLDPRVGSRRGMTPPTVAGLDGCRGGWVMVRAPLDVGPASSVELVADLDGVVSALEAGDLGAAGIDIP